jgi:hypothetical protein
MDFNSGVIYLCAIGICAYYSYRTGHKQGLEDGCEHALDQLMDDKIIHIDDKGEIEQWDSYYGEQRWNENRKNEQNKHDK